MSHRFYRTELLIGSAGLERLAAASVTILGIGGVGSYTAEALARAGIGRLRLVDHDDVEITNLNRQLHALENTLAEPKVTAMARRLALINPELIVEPLIKFYNADETGLLSDCDWVVDAVDTVSAKLSIIDHCVNAGTPVISAMGAGNKLDATQLRISDISKTSVCPLARVVRKELGKRGIRRGVPVVWSPEAPLTPREHLTYASRRQLPGSISYLPGVAGLLIASHIVNSIIAD